MLDRVRFIDHWQPQELGTFDMVLEIRATRLGPTDHGTLSFIRVLRPDMLFYRPNARSKTRYWPQMNTDERG